MAFDQELADRLRTRLRDEPGITEQRMFGGVGFLVGGHMAVAASSRGGLLVRVDPAEGAALLEQDGVEPMEMRGRVMTGWLLVDADRVRGDDELSPWVARGVGYARTLPPKT